ncbi:MAG: AraC family transcriptional regulator, partial [Clostridia bacterium]
MIDFVQTSFLITNVESATPWSNDGSMYPLHHAHRRLHGLIYNTRGTGVYRFCGQTIPFAPNSVVFLPKGLEYRIELTYEGEIGCMVVNFDMPDDVCPSPLVLHKGAQVFSGSFSALMYTWAQKAFHYRMDCMAQLYQLLLSLQRQQTRTDAPASTRLTPALVYVNEHYHESTLRVSDLAQRVGLHVRQFSTLFGETYSVQPRKYVLMFRIQRAKDLLATGTYGVAQTAAATGFGDAYYFSRTFKAVVG